MLAMMSLGVGEIFGSYFMGRFIDKFGSKNSSIVNMFLILAATLIVIYYLFRNDFGFLAFFMAFMWGF
jgi:predicted MFS family arabinose efflux permease